MKILLICRDMDCGGAQTHVLELAVGLARLGNDISVASASGGLVKHLEKNGVRHVNIPLEKKDVLSLLKHRRALSRLISEGFDVVHAHTRISAMLSDGICRRKRTCFVSTAHAHFKINSFLKRVCRWGERQIAVSRDLYFYLLENAPRVSERNICVINNGIDIKKFSPESLNSSRKKSGITVLFLSRLDGDCSAAAYSLCRISERLFEACPQIRIVIGGGGDAFCDILALADAIEKRTGVRIVDAVGRVDNVLDFLSRGDIFVGVSRAALEAMACGIPTVIGGDEGFLGVADEKNLKRGEYSNFCCRGERFLTDSELFDALLRLIRMNDKERAQLSCAARGFVCEHHSTEKMALKTENFYKKAFADSAYRVKDRQKGGVLLCGYYGFGNMGDELMLESAVRKIENEVGDVSVRILSRGRKGISCGRRVSFVRRSSPFAVMRAIKRADKVVFGGGTLLQNATSRRSLAYYLALLKYAQFFGKRTELWGNGIGDIKGKRSRRAVAKTLKCCDRVGIRDGASMEKIEEMCREFGVEISGVCAERDLALEPWLYGDIDARESEVLVRLGLAEGKRFAVFSVMGNAAQEHRKSIFEYAKKLGREGVTPIFAVMYPAQDLALSRKLCKDLGGILAYPFWATDIVALMRGAEVVCSMRYHALVLAHVAGASFVGIGDDQKIKSFCSEYGGDYIDAKKTGR